MPEASCSASCDDDEVLIAGPSLHSSLPDESDEEVDREDPLYREYPALPHEPPQSRPKSEYARQPSGSHPIPQDSKRSAYPSQPSPTESEQLTALLRETLDRFARAGERYDAFLSARDQTSAPSRTASPSDSRSLLSKLAQGPPLRTFHYPQLPLRTFDYSLGNLRSYIRSRRDRQTAASLAAIESPEEELLACRQDLRSIIASSGPVSRAEYVTMVEEAITGRWKSVAEYAWDEEMGRSGKAD